ncbi:outer membrane protein [Methylobacterium organophilum]|nr:porin family protein [Methylobacterium organophilum]UMY19876.1 porin family protein [Methylobacterium organophilum]
MKKLVLTAAAVALLTSAASAADLPRRVEPPVVFTPVPVFTWTGFFAGVETSYSFLDRQRYTTTGIDTANITAINLGQRVGAVRSRDIDGLGSLGGGFGYNYQFTPGSGIVVGAALNVDWTDIHKNTVAIGNLGDPSVYRSSLEWLGTLNGRVGYAFDRFMIYGTGGLAFGYAENSAAFYGNDLTLRYAGGDISFRTGFAYGGGVEYAIPEDSFLNYLSVGKYLGIKSSAVTLKAEYLHYDLGSRNVLVANTGLPGVFGTGYNVRFNNEGNIIRAGFNYKFGE